MNTALPQKPTTFIRDVYGQDRPIEPPTSIWKRHRLLGFGVLMSVLILGILAIKLERLASAAGSVDRATLTLATVERGSFVREVTADGQVIAASSPTLYASAPGTVALRVHAGDSVAKGQLLAVIASPDLTTRLSQEDTTLQALTIDRQRAQLEANRRLEQMSDAYTLAKADEQIAQREFERCRKAFEMGAYAEYQFLKAKDTLERARFSVQQARASYKSQPAQNRFDIDSKQMLLDRQQILVTDLKRQVDSLNVRSPIDGQIGQVQVADRANVARDTPLMTIVDLSALEVEIRVPQHLARDLRPGMTADLEGDGRHWPGRVSGVSPEVVRGDVTARLRFTDGKPVRLRQSQRLVTRIQIDRRDNVLMLDRGSFIDQEGGHFAYVVRGDVAQRRAIQLGASSISKVEILQGLEVGERVVIAGTDSFNGASQVILSH